MQQLTRAALAALTLVGLVTGVARAQTPPMRTFGTATVEGQPAPAGTVVQVLVGEQMCGEGTVRRVNDDLPLGYVVDVISASTQPGCAGEGERVSFRVGGRPATETTEFETGAFRRLDLTVTGQVQTPTPGAATPPPFGSTTPTPAPGAATGTPTAAPTGTATGTPAGTETATPGATGTADPSATPSITATSSSTVTATPTVRATLSPRATPTPGGDGDDEGGGATAAVALVAGLAVAGAAGVGYLLYRRSRTG